MLAFSTTLLVLGILHYLAVAEACDSEIGVWVPTKKDNRFSNLSLARFETKGLKAWDKAYMQSFWDEGVKTDTHLCAGFVYWNSTAEADPQIVLMNSVTTFPLSGDRAFQRYSEH
jgi:hypothetical protein